MNTLAPPQNQPRRSSISSTASGKSNKSVRFSQEVALRGYVPNLSTPIKLEPTVEAVAQLELPLVKLTVTTLKKPIHKRLSGAFRSIASVFRPNTYMTAKII
ncbi:hypothetical protein DSO57_1017409 [Entomophthora muscae]|uniref:Uncharacterized protein n=2 Tax=Entomophthora muscae TaxID=34485 RepID=A0ACC2TFA9_9FUNG|nr:hypothetical protein DSO57_1037465 [Entomophthora muscae]KAJ9073343.1 hypothetical protein DSO57_1017409 [Entomophthora muscae]